MRSAISKISSRSWLITSTAEPARARSIMAWRMVADAPASTPQVGWLTTSTPACGRARGRRRISADCRLKARAASGSGLPLRTSKSSATRSLIDCALPRSTKPVAHQSISRGMAGQDDIFRQREARDRAMAQALFRHEGGAAPAPLGDAEMAASRAVDLHRLGIAAATLAGDGVEQFRLAVAGDAGDADHLAAAHIQADIVERHGEGTVGRLVQAIEPQPGQAAQLVGAGLHRVDVAADHQLAPGWRRFPSADRPGPRPCRGAGWWRCGRGASPPPGGG